jgi:hypothetical protein
MALTLLDKNNLETIEFEKYLLELMDEIGFIEGEKGETTVGYITEYKYYCPYLKDKHYTMVVFKNKSYTTDMNRQPLYKSIEYRLYIHMNIDGSYHSSPFQISINSEWNRNYIKSQMEKIFIDVARNRKLEEIGIM